MAFEGFEEFKARVKALEEVNRANEDIASSNSIDFYKKWGGVGLSVPGAFIDWAGIQAYLIKNEPQLFGDWSTHLEVGEELESMIGALAEPLVEYVNIERKISLAQRLNALASDGFVELVFDVESGSPVYQVTDNETAKEHKKDLDAMIEAYGRF